MVERAPWGSLDYLAAVRLRREVLRRPLGLDFSPEELAAEAEAEHFVAKRDGLVIGALFLMPDAQGRSAKLRQVCVDPRFRGEGIGLRLCASAEALARERGWLHLHLAARAEARAFWLRAGYQPCGAGFLDLGIPHLPMAKQLEGPGSVGAADSRILP
ncbi:MAG: GNAT family N-acetyltransferase [Spirochaetes bacterium]|nr:GNAT family N-acetyltransferase [Spirochaetota bacterium]